MSLKRSWIGLLPLLALALPAIWSRSVGETSQPVPLSRQGGEAGFGAQPGTRTAPGQPRSPAQVEVPEGAPPGSRAELRRQAPPEDPVEAFKRRLQEREDDLNVQQLIRQATSGERDERLEALSALGFLEPRPEVVAACLQALQDPVDDVRVEAVLALTSLEAASAVSALSGLLRSDPSAEVREAAADALRHLKEKH